MKVDQKTLLSLTSRGYDSPILKARMAFMECEGLRRYIEPMQYTDRVYPSMLPTQASGRWSTTDPPLVNWPADCVDPGCPRVQDIGHVAHATPGCTGFSCRDVIVPDPGWWWMGFDWDAIEARIVAVGSGDDEDIEAFRNGWDIHVMTASRIFNLPMPPDKKDPHRAPVAEAWRQEVKWGGKDDGRRVCAKVCRYSLLYSKIYKAILGAKDLDKVLLQAKISRPELLRIAQRFMQLKVKLRNFKQKEWDQCWRTQESRTYLGERRRLYGDRDTIEKDGLNHKIQGTVAGMMNQVLIAFQREWPISRLVVNKHDGALWAFPDSLTSDTVMPRVREIVQAERQIGTNVINFPATFGLYLEDGRHIDA